MRSNLAGPFVASLLARNGQSQRWAAEQIGISHVALGERLRGVKFGVSTERLLDVARLAHASPEQIDLLSDLDAIDRGVLPLDAQTKPEEVRAAREAIAGARK
jgi:hypothetical protein